MLNTTFRGYVLVVFNLTSIHISNWEVRMYTQSNGAIYFREIYEDVIYKTSLDDFIRTLYNPAAVFTLSQFKHD